nr:DUF2946 family protein [Bradyrhizobium sp. BR13661]
MAPIAACWATAIAAADPLASVEICHGASGNGSAPSDDRGDDGSCTLCCVVLADASLHLPQSATLPAPVENVSNLIWQQEPAVVLAARTGSNSQARAPPPAI